MSEWNQDAYDAMREESRESRHARVLVSTPVREWNQDAYDAMREESRESRHARVLVSTPVRAYTPRRCSARWLDADCPREVLCIIDHGEKEADRFDVFYTETHGTDDPRGPWLTYISMNDRGHYYHGEMPAHDVAAYRYRMKHRYAAWSSLPDVVKARVRQDLADAAGV